MRAKENWAPLPGGDMLTVQSNLVPLDQLDKLHVFAVPIAQRIGRPGFTAPANAGDDDE